jgi:YD repeat-containing protein
MSCLIARTTAAPNEPSYRLWQIRTYDGGTTHLQLEYGYDDVGNVVQIVDEQAQTHSFAYDALDRLTGASAPAGGRWAAYSRWRLSVDRLK